MSGSVLKVALPKGSLQKSTFDLMKRAGFSIRVGDRSYFPWVDDSSLNLTLVRAQEISRYVELGAFDIGITGSDWVKENQSDIVEIETLAYCRQDGQFVRWVVAVPEDSEIHSVSDLQGKRVATELVRTTRNFFEKKGVVAEVEFSWGATEVKPPLLADAIVELTETGGSLRQNRLRIVEEVCLSQTKIIANKDSFLNSWKREKMEAFSMLMKGVLEADMRVGVKLNVHRSDKDRVLEQLPTVKSPTISPLLDSDWFSVEVVVEKKVVREILPQLKRAGACDIFEYPLNNIIF